MNDLYLTPEKYLTDNLETIRDLAKYVVKFQKEKPEEYEQLLKQLKFMREFEQIFQNLNGFRDEKK